MAKAWDDLEDWQKGERLDGMAASIRIKGAQHHAEIETVLCSRCEHGMVYRQKSGSGGIRTVCNRGSAPMPVPSDIAECSQYDPKAKVSLTLEDMAKVAITIDTRALPPSTNTYL